MARALVLQVQRALVLMAEVLMPWWSVALPAEGQRQ
jgi:hypothetical protein